MDSRYIYKNKPTYTNNIQLLYKFVNSIYMQYPKKLKQKQYYTLQT